MYESVLAAQEVRVADLLVEALVVELDDAVDSVAQHRLREKLGLKLDSCFLHRIYEPVAPVSRSRGPCLA